METEMRDIAPDSSRRVLWHLGAALAAILPAAGAGFAVRGVMNVFRGMALTGSGGIGSVAIGLYEANRALIIAAAVAAVVSGGLCIAVIRKPQQAAAFPGLLLSLGPFLACIPAILLWRLESFIIAVLAPDAGGSAVEVADASQRVANLVIATFGSAVGIIPIVAAALAISLARPRPLSGLPPATVWIAATVLLLGLAAVFYMRSSYLYQVGLTGQL